MIFNSKICFLRIFLFFSVLLIKLSIIILLIAYILNNLLILYSSLSYFFQPFLFSCVIWSWCYFLFFFIDNSWFNVLVCCIWSTILFFFIFTFSCFKFFLLHSALLILIYKNCISFSSVYCFLLLICMILFCFCSFFLFISCKIDCWYV